MNAYPPTGPGEGASIPQATHRQAQVGVHGDERLAQVLRRLQVLAHARQERGAWTAARRAGRGERERRGL
jgi:hypothetical protein